MDTSLENTPETEVQSSHLACGARLRTERTAQDMTVDAVAKQLRLGNKQVEALENDDFSVLPEPTIVKGFIRNYAKLLKIPAAPMLSAYAEMTPKPEQYALVINSSINMKISEKGKTGSSLYVFLTIFFLLGLCAWVFYQSYIQKPEIANTMEEPSRVLPAITLHVLPTQTVTLPEAGLVVAEPEAETVGTTQLTFDATQETWVNVVNAAGVELYNTILYAGDREVIDVLQPTEIVVGNAHGATLDVDGKSMDLAPYTRGNVARVRLN